MIIVHHLNNSRSQRVLWLLEELNIPYEIKHYERDKVTMRAPRSLEAVHPLGKSPVITDNGVTVAESGAIIEYLANLYGKGTLAPADGTKERLRYTYWLHYAEGSLMPPLLMKLIFSRVDKGKMPFFARPVARAIAKGASEGFIDPEIAKHLAYVNAELGKSAWFAGDSFTAADVQMSFPLEAAAARGGANAYPNIARFLERIHARPAYKRALERGGAYDILT